MPWRASANAETDQPAGQDQTARRLRAQEAQEQERIPRRQDDAGERPICRMVSPRRPAAHA